MSLDNCCQKKCCLDNCQCNSGNLLKMVLETAKKLLILSFCGLVVANVHIDCCVKLKGVVN